MFKRRVAVFWFVAFWAFGIKYPPPKSPSAREGAFRFAPHFAFLKWQIPQLFRLWILLRAVVLVTHFCYAKTASLVSPRLHKAKSRNDTRGADFPFSVFRSPCSKIQGLRLDTHPQPPPQGRGLKRLVFKHPLHKDGSSASD